MSKLPEKELTRLIQAFERASRDIIAILAASGGRSQYFRMDRMKRLRLIRQVLAELEGKSVSWANKTIPRAYRLGAKDAAEAMAEFDEKGFRVLSFAGVPTAAVRSLIEASETALKLSIAGVYREATRTLGALEQAAIKDRLTSALIRGAALEETKSNIISDLKASGVTALRAQGGTGRKFTMRDYADIVVRHQTMYAYNTATTNRLLSAGRRFAMVSVVRPDIDGYDICNVWEGKLVDLTSGVIPGRENKSPKVALPPYHPRCRHVLRAISFAEIEAKFPEQYAEAVEFYEARKSA